MFEGRVLLVATKHKKELVIAPLFEEKLGVKCVVDLNFDTDKLGTFTGEIERIEDSLTTARNKCLLAMQLSGYDMAIANEGSFGAHPSVFFAHADDEIIIFIDKKNDLEIVIRELSTETNFNSSKITTEKELSDFANSVQFPSHGLIIRATENDNTNIIKGITDWETLLKSFNTISNNFGSVHIETDMRAMYNPTRMKVIEKAAAKLVDKINTYCPQCKTPGFGITSSKLGLPCQLCQYPTRSIISFVYSCKKCSFTKEEKYPHGKFNEDPMYCDNCNP